MPNISGVIITFNEEQCIERCIRSLEPVVDEIVVVDSFSTDRTKDICQSLNVRYIENKFEGYRDQKKFAANQASYNIVLSLDADEALSDKLAQSILTVKKNWEFDAYKFNRLNNYCNQWIYHTDWNPDCKIRLYDRRKGEWKGLNIHESISMQNDATIGTLKGNLLHWSIRTFEDYLNKINSFSTFSANEYYKSGRKSSLLKIITNPIWSFIKSYVLKLGFLDGFNGFVISALSAHTRFLKYVKLYYLQKRQQESPPRG
jgi:Glycosyltransferases involved in cell wall biogenesis